RLVLRVAVSRSRGAVARPARALSSLAVTFVGISDHAGWAVLVTVRARTVIDRRRVTLVEDGVPVMPHHHDAQGLPAEDGVALVEHVRASAERCAAAVLETLASEVRGIRGIALRAQPDLPPTIAERIADYRAMC